MTYRTNRDLRSQINDFLDQADAQVVHLHEIAQIAMLAYHKRDERFPKVLGHLNADQTAVARCLVNAHNSLIVA